MKSLDIRKQFLDFFKSKEHLIVSSSPMVVKNDPTLMFTNAGMNQFKDIFLGNAKPKAKRVANTQKCLRVSGKHNDLEEVGIDTYHHTMFEMLGNWSFGDYFKKEAIEWSWELLTEVYGIDKDRLYVTVFGGDKLDNTEMDNEAYNIWKEIIPEDRIILGSKKDNFWEMGDMGPCGPCSEVHVDIRDKDVMQKISGKELVNTDNPEVIRDMELVFIQYERIANGSLKNLPSKHIDTGMGFERLAMVLQKKKSNYDTDIFQPLIKRIAMIACVNYGDDYKKDVAMRVISDHLRAVAFAIADGEIPSNNKAGYVIRRILRRAVRYAYTFLDIREPIIYNLVDVLIANMGDTFPELTQRKDLIEKIIFEEEASFLRTLESGLKRIEQIINELNEEKTVWGKKAFELYDTFGFPIDLTRLILKEKNLEVNEEEFNIELQKQKQRSKDDASIDSEDWIIVNSNESETDFVGYDFTETEASITKYRKVKNKDGVFYQLVFSKTPFYGESGGQVGDRGIMLSEGEDKIEIFDTKKENNLIVHFVKSLPKELNKTFKLIVNIEKRQLTEANHSATHLLHSALRMVLGTHVQQKGSLVNDEHLRFDFSHFSKLTDEEIAKVEETVNMKIRENICIDEKRNMNYEEAVKDGATALFGEKYGDYVRVITFDKAYSVELCGGTHVKATGNIGFFKIISETAIAAGIRRITAISSSNAEKYINDNLKTLDSIRELFQNPKDVLKSINNIIEQNNQLTKRLELFKQDKIKNYANTLLDKIKKHNDINYIIENIEVESIDSLKDIAYSLKSKMDKLFCVLTCENENKASLVIIVSEELVNLHKLNASTLVKELAKEINGGGGGQAYFATAGGKKPEGINNLLNKAKEFVYNIKIKKMTGLVAIVGRPNVGKSTLFNRLTESKHAIVHESPGVTRDRHYGDVLWNGKSFSIIDTGGYVIGSEDEFELEIRKQVEIAVEEAEVILFVLDVNEEINPLDEDVASFLRRSKRKVVLVANKVDNNAKIGAASIFYRLGLGEVFCISSLNGSGTGELLDHVVSILPDIKTEEDDTDIPRFAIVGKPNVGKSSLINALIGEERNIVTPISGTTRDTIYTRFQKFGFDFYLLDTAGIRKKQKVTENIEFYSVMRSISAIEYSDVCLLLIDAEEGFNAQDRNIFSLIQRNHKGIIILVNKWDLIEKGTNSVKEYTEKIHEEIAPFVDVPIVFISVLEKQRVIKAIEEALKVFKNRTQRISTSSLNELMLPIIEATPPPIHKGKQISIKFVTQIPTHYPSFAFFCNLPQYVKDSYKRFLENKLRSNFDLKGVPIEIYFRKK